MSAPERTIADLVYVGLNANVVAIDRFTGEIAWTWKAPQGSGYTALLLDGDRLIAAANGYVYCLDPLFGQEVWSNPMKGYGLGVTSIVSVHGRSSDTSGMGAAKAAADAAAAAAAV